MIGLGGKPLKVLGQFSLQSPTPSSQNAAATKLCALRVEIENISSIFGHYSHPIPYPKKLKTFKIKLNSLTDYLLKTSITLLGITREAQQKCTNLQPEIGTFRL